VPPFKKTLLDAMPYIDFLFGNETEARAFAASEGWDTQDVAEIALKVLAGPPQAQLAKSAGAGVAVQAWPFAS
jgi:sugar/nucleoside kinase (ribokinase family)